MTGDETAPLEEHWFRRATNFVASLVISVLACGAVGLVGGYLLTANMQYYLYGTIVGPASSLDILATKAWDEKYAVLRIAGDRVDINTVLEEDSDAHEWSELLKIWASSKSAFKAHRRFSGRMHDTVFNDQTTIILISGSSLRLVLQQKDACSGIDLDQGKIELVDRALGQVTDHLADRPTHPIRISEKLGYDAAWDGVKKLPFSTPHPGAKGSCEKLLGPDTIR